MTEALQQKRECAKKYLGENYILHPKYKMQERHSFLVDRWFPHRILREVETRAKEAGRI